MSKKTKYPDSGYNRPSSDSSSSLIVKVTGESGENFGSFDFSTVNAPRELLIDLAKAFQLATGSSGRWRTKSSVTAGSASLRGFATAIASDNLELTSMAEFTPEMWWSWRDKKKAQTRWPGQINLAKGLLYEIEDLPETTRRAIRGREKKPKNRKYSAYTTNEYRRIYAAAWATVRAARKRIRTNVMALESYRNGEEPADAPTLKIKMEDWTHGRLLDHIQTTGRFPNKTIPGPVKLDRQFRSMLSLEITSPGPQALYASPTEVFAGIILLVCERGFNLSVINELSANPHKAEAGNSPIAVQSLDKPRRGSNARYFSSSFSGKSARIWNAIAEITQPARDHLETLGTPTNSLLVCRATSGPSGDQLFKTNWLHYLLVSDSWQKQSKLLDDSGNPLVVGLRRLRLTEQVVNQRSNQNSNSLSESVYRKSEQHTKDLAKSVILQGQLDAVSDAKAVIEIRTISKAEATRAEIEPKELAKKLNVSTARVRQLMSGHYNTAITACMDIKNSPFTQSGDVCTASFLHCFSCRNAVATPDHLPRLVLLHDAISDLASVVSEAVWNADYAIAHQQITSLLQIYTTSEERVEAIKNASKEDRNSILMLLNGRFDT